MTHEKAEYHRRHARKHLLLKALQEAKTEGNIHYEMAVKQALWREFKWEE